MRLLERAEHTNFYFGNRILRGNYVESDAIIMNTAGSTRSQFSLHTGPSSGTTVEPTDWTKAATKLGAKSS